MRLSDDPSHDAETLAETGSNPASGTPSPLIPPPSPEAWDPAATDFEHYTVLRHPDGSAWELGRGAMGVTYKAHDTRLQCDVALKVIRRDVLALNPHLHERFLREARGAARLRHPNVANVFHLGDNAARGVCFYAMELIDGETLLARVGRLGPLPVPLALEVCTQVARALTAAGQQGLLHRDIKPANLMLVAHRDPAAASAWTQPGGASGDGAPLVKVIDFGLVKAATDGDGLTVSGGFVGTPQFASPEQLDGERDAGAPLDGRSDIYSLGVTLWFALTGKVPFTGRSLEEIHRSQTSRPLPVEALATARVPRPVCELLASMLAHEPAHRPPTPQALLEALRVCRDALPGAAPASVGWTPAPVPPPPTPRSPWLTVAAAGLLLAVAALTVASQADWRSWFVHAPAKSIAVLPFENLSADPENAFFADGVQDDVLTSLSKIGELQVISRASVSAYREPAAQANPARIGQTLGVAHLVEGSVRRAGNRVVISVQLIDAASGRQLWAEKYDRPLADALSLQGQVAAEIADKLRTNLSPAERARVVASPTVNTDAYVLYLRARELATRAAFKREDYEAAASLFEQAIKLDPRFALAHARLSQTHSQIAHLFEPTAALQAAALASADTALSIDPNLGEAHLALALCAYWIDRNLSKARAEFATASRTLPNDPDIAGHLAAIRRRQGEWQESTADFRRAMLLNPRNPDLPYELASNYAAVGDWPHAAAMADRAVALAPDVPTLKLWRGDLLFHWKGDLTLLRAALAEIPAGAEADEVTDWLRYQVAMVDRDFATAERILAGSPTKVFTIFDYAAPRPKEYLLGLAALARGDRAAADAWLQTARPVCEAAVRETPGNAFRHAQLGLLYAALGWRDAALGEGWQAAALTPEEKDAADGATVTARRTQIYALLGDADGALPLIEHLLKTPSLEFVTPADLRLRPEWDALRNDARFQQLTR